jgi:hypothetical protein
MTRSVNPSCGAKWRPLFVPREQTGIEPIGFGPRLKTGTLQPEASFNDGQEFAMQAIVHKVIHAFSFKHQDSDDDGKRAHREAVELATELLENYKQQLARRTSLAQRR